ncbi:MAG: glycosyltransferase family 39 protein [Victivallales bacterium]|nr:glycosyltransferase family 39 protein [Victivallales bacterium]
MWKNIFRFRETGFCKKFEDDPDFSESRLRRMFYVFLAGWTLLWFLLPLIFLESSFIDVLENIVWGSNFQWGYDKNPWFGAWVGYYSYLITGKSLWVNYLLSQVFVATGITSVWLLARKMVNSRQAYVAAVSLAAINFYGIKSVELCDDVMALGLWPLIYLFFYKALNGNRLRYWLLVGFFSALALMTKYLAPVIFVSMFIVMLFTPRGRRAFLRPGVYLAGIVLLLISLPNLIFLIENEGTAISYAFGRAGLNPQNQSLPLSVNFNNPLCALNRAAGVLVLILLPLSVFLCRASSAPMKDEQYRFNRFFIVIMCWAPFTLMLLFSLLTGGKINYSWVVPCFALTGLFAVLYYRPAVNGFSLCLFNTIITGLAVMFALIFAIRSTWHQGYVKLYCDYENFPSESFAMMITEAWNKEFKKPLKYVIGDRQTSCGVVVYSPDSPVAFFNANPLLSPWVCPEDVGRQGAAFIWYGKADEIPSFIRDFVKNYRRVTPPREIQAPRAVPAWFRCLTGRDPLPVIASYMFMPPDMEVSGTDADNEDNTNLTPNVDGDNSKNVCRSS